MRFHDSFDDRRPPRRDDNDRERPSWRELDSQRDRSAHVTRDRPETRSSRTAQRGETLAKKALADLFQPKKSKEQLAAWKKVCEAKGRLFIKRSNGYVEKFGVPRDWDDLLRLLDHEDTSLLLKLLDQIMELARNESSIRRDLLGGKLRVLKMTAEDPRFIQELEKAQIELDALT